MVILKPSWAALALLTCVIFLGLFACQLSCVLVEDLWRLRGPCRGLLPPRDWSPVLQGPSSGGLSPPWFWKPDVLCPYSMRVWLPWSWSPNSGDPCWGCTLSEFPAGTSASLAFLALFLAAPLQFFFSFWTSRVRSSLPAPQDSPNFHYLWAGVPPVSGSQSCPS